MLLAAIKLTQNTDPDKYFYSGYRIAFEALGNFSLSDGNGIGKNVIIFGADMSSSVHIDNKKNDISILGKGPTDGLDSSSTLTTDKEHCINFTEQEKKFLHYNGSNSYIFVNSIEIYKFKA